MTGMAAALAPTRLPIGVHAQVTARASTPDYDAWIRQVEPVGDCTRPVRLARTTLTVHAGTGEVLNARHDRERRRTAREELACA